MEPMVELKEFTPLSALLEHFLQGFQLPFNEKIGIRCCWVVLNGDMVFLAFIIILWI